MRNLITGPSQTYLILPVNSDNSQTKDLTNILIHHNSQTKDLTQIKDLTATLIHSNQLVQVRNVSRPLAVATLLKQKLSVPLPRIIIPNQ